MLVPGPAYWAEESFTAMLSGHAGRDLIGQCREKRLVRHRTVSIN